MLFYHIRVEYYKIQQSFFNVFIFFPILGDKLIEGEFTARQIFLAAEILLGELSP